MINSPLIPQEYLNFFFELLLICKNSIFEKIKPFFMKKIIPTTFFLLLISILVSCGGKGSYFEQFSNDKKFTSRIDDLNKTIDEIRAKEKGSLIKEDLYYLEYSYGIGKSDSYVISYRFDEKGCYEVAIYSYFIEEANTKNVIAFHVVICFPI